MVGSDGVSWEHHCELSRASAAAVANADNCLAGLDAVLSVLHAALLASDEGDDPALPPFLAERLHVAAKVLVRSADESIDKLRALGGMP